MYGLEDNNQKKVAINAGDCEECEKFFQYFNVPMPEELKNALEAFKSDPTVENQDKVKLNIAKTMIESEHEIFKDRIFEKLMPEIKESYDAILFEKEFEDHLSGKGK